MPRLAALNPITGEVIRASKATAVAYERQRPGELVSQDVEKLSRRRELHGRDHAHHEGHHDGSMAGAVYVRADGGRKGAQVG